MRTRGRAAAWCLLVMPVLASVPVLAGWRVTPAGGTPPRRRVVEIRGMAFQPSDVDVAPGDTVVWVNRDIVPHTAKAPGPGGWDTGTITQGQSRLQVLQRSGTYAYACTLHPTMRARLVVRAGAGTEAR